MGHGLTGKKGWASLCSKQPFLFCILGAVLPNRKLILRMLQGLTEISSGTKLGKNTLLTQNFLLQLPLFVPCKRAFAAAGLCGKCSLHARLCALRTGWLAASHETVLPFHGKSSIFEGENCQRHINKSKTA